MAITSEFEPINRYDGNASTTVFAYTFKIFAATDLFVSPIAGVTQILNTHYTVSGVGSPTGGNVTFVTAPPVGTGNVVFSLDLPYTQETQYPEGQKFPSSQVEQDLDRAVLRDLVLLGLTGRAVLLPIEEVATVLNRQMPALANRISKFFAWDASGNIIAAAGTSANLGPVSSFINTLLDDADAATARATLGITSLSTADNDFRVTGSGDSTKKMAHEVDSFTTATTRTRFEADEDCASGQSWEVKNMTVTVTVSANQIIVALKTKNGTDPSATDPIIFKFRNVSDTSGVYTTVTLTSSLSITVSNGSTLGTVSAIAHRIYFGIANDGGTLRLFVYNPLLSVTGPPAQLDLKALQENELNSSTAEGGAGAADSAHVLYSATAFTSKAIKLLGYFESTQATAGVWATAPSRIHILKPWDKRTGDILQRITKTTGEVATGTTTLPADDTIPQNTEGNEFMTAAITPFSAVNLIEIYHQGVYAFNAATNANMSIALFQDSIANAVAAMIQARDLNIGTMSEPILKHLAQPGLTSAITYKIRAGVNGAGTVTFNGSASARLFGGVFKSMLRLEEQMV